MKMFAILALFAGMSAAHADGFECQTLAGDLNVKVYNHTDASEGTRNAAVMVLSDTSVQQGRKTIAKFSDVNTTLTNSGAEYTARVDLRFNDSGRKGENVSGTKLGEIRTIDLDVDFSYAAPVQAGEQLQASMVIEKRNGEKIARTLSCARYLKN